MGEMITYFSLFFLDVYFRGFYRIETFGRITSVRLVMGSNGGRSFVRGSVYIRGFLKGFFKRVEFLSCKGCSI